MYYLIENDEDLRFEDIEDVLEHCISVEYYEEDEDSFDECVNSDGDVEVFGHWYAPSEILREMGDYHSSIQDWAQEQVENCWSDYRWEVERLRDGQSCYVCNYEVYAYEDEEEPEEVKPSEEVISAIETQVEITIKQQETVHEENKRLEDEFMNVFQTLS